MRLCVIYTEYRKPVTSDGSGHVRYRRSVKRPAPAPIWMVTGKSWSSDVIPSQVST